MRKRVKIHVTTRSKGTRLKGCVGGDSSVCQGKEMYIMHFRYEGASGFQAATDQSEY